MSFTIPVKVRVLLPTLLINDDDMGVSYSGTNLTLTYPGLDVPTILKDGVSSTTFTFERPDKITLDVSADGERYIAQVYLGITDTDIDALIVTIDREIVAMFTNYDLPAAGYLEDWSSMLTAARYLRLYAIASEENTDKAEALETLVMDAMKGFQVKVSSDKSNIIVKVNA